MHERSTMAEYPEIRISTMRETSEINLSTMRETPEINLSTMRETPEINLSTMRKTPEVNVSRMRKTPEVNVSRMPKTPEVTVSTMRETPELSVSRMRETPEVSVSRIRETPEINVSSMLESLESNIPTMLENPDDVDVVRDQLPVPPRRSKRKKEYTPSECSDFSGDEVPIPPQRSKRKDRTIEKLPDKVLQNIFSYLSHREICRMATVCKRWRMVAYDTRLWTHVSLRPEISGLHVGSLESLLALISIRFGPSLRYIELPIELITHTVLHELASKCPNLTHMLLDFSTAMQLHDFSEMQAFPTKLRYLCICLSEVIFMEGFMRKIYNFINGLEILHLIGTYEKVEEEEEEIYEVINVHKLKSATPNLRVINLYGINFVDDSHIDAFSSNCIQLECLAVNYCNKVTGSTMKTLFQRSRRLTCLLMNGCSLHSEYVMQVEWEKSSVQELDVTATDLSTECLIDMLTRIPNLRFLSAGQINGFNDTVIKAWIEAGTARNLVALDVDASDNLTDEALHRFLSRHGSQLWGLVLSGMPHITDQLWQSVLQLLTNAKILIMGTQERLGVNIHVDQLMDGIANSCPNLERLELRWDPENLRFSDKSQKAIDILRVKCLKLKCLVLSDGRYYEIVKANFERADRTTVVRTSTNCRVSNYYLLSNYKDLIFN